MNSEGNLHKSSYGQQGNILVSALLVLVLMNLLGMGLVQASVWQSTLATFKTVDSNVFTTTDSCANNVMNWFRQQNSTPSFIAVSNINENSLNFMFSSSDSTSVENKLYGYNYNCSTSYLVSKNIYAPSGPGTGGNVNDAGGDYSSSSSNYVKKDYYKIVATGNGPKNSTKTINTIISVSY